IDRSDVGCEDPADTSRVGHETIKGGEGCKTRDTPLGKLGSRRAAQEGAGRRIGGTSKKNRFRRPVHLFHDGSLTQNQPIATKLCRTTKPAITTLTILISLIRIFRLGPLVSLNGSPTVSPTTAALWDSLPLPPRFPASMYFLALSQAPPLLLMKIARQNPLVKLPANNPTTPPTPNSMPTTIGNSNPIALGRIISNCAARVLNSIG